MKDTPSSELGELYGVPVDQFLPEAHDRRASPEDSSTEDGRRPEKLVIDLIALEQHGEPELEPIRHYLDAIKLRRGDYNGRVLTVRSTDVWAMAAMCTTDSDALVRSLDRLQILRAR